ncbi:MAG: single-stranded-DNA-specific exonuclease RecJ [Lachnospiraceae bacterium]|nr:single-stranded-DNA-specific exonuclease RecJ [Lachnospiraceae bacterium]
MEKWLVAAKKADFNKWATDFCIDPVVARILRNRELTDEEQVQRFLRGTLEDCHSYRLLKDMDKAVEIIDTAIGQGQKIRVIGDYDVDGICSAYILTKGFAWLGANVDTAIPHRIHDGYGLNDHLIELAKADGVELIVTCDNGIAAAGQIALAASLGIKVVVTDHHEVPYELERDPETGAEVRREILPPAAAVVDPKQKDCTYPFKGICGGMVAYKLMQALLGRRKSRLADEEDGASKQDSASKQGVKSCDSETLLEELLEFAAFSTVCDVMELLDENRIVVKEGLKRMQHSRNLGLQALIEVNGLDPAKISAYHLGFVIGPCLNATGRLDTAKRALELLQSENKTQAMQLAAELKELNDSRKNLTAEGVEQAERYILERHMEQDKVLVIYLPDVHESLAGIIAGRIRESYNKPTIVLTKGEDGVKGSGRSIETYHMYDALTQVKDLFTKYGGHKMAAGLSLEETHVTELQRRLNENCRLTEADFVPVIHIDVPMPVDYATEQLAGQLEILEPFGVGNPKPLFAQKDLCFLTATRMGTSGKCARFGVLTPGNRRVQMVIFRNLDKFEALLVEKYGSDSVDRLYAGQGDYRLSVVYQLGLNTYRGITEKQLIIQNFCL